tara:strand:+ start:4560 stop:5351 length:792 start_codon:yes stop_codon:yes gene_type:complete
MEKNEGKEVKINIRLKKNSIINIYTNYQEEIKYEGKAILLEKVSDGDSFYLHNEKVEPKDKKEYNEKDNIIINKYNRIIIFFKGVTSKKPTRYCRRLYNELIKQRKDNVDDFLRMKKVLKKYRKKHNDSIQKIGTLLREFDDYYIIRFIQQDRQKWQHSIFSYEKWKIKFIEDQTGWKVDWTTTRKIRILKCVNPTESMRRSELVEHTTYDGMSSRQYDRILDIKKYNKKKQKEKNESTFINDNEMEDLILIKLNKKKDEKKD